MTFWTQEREERLRALFAEGLSASKIAKEIGASTRNVVIGKLNRLKLTWKDRPKSAAHATPARYWNQYRVAKLRELHGRGLSVGFIARALGCPFGAVERKLHRLGLGTRPRGPEARPEPATPRRIQRHVSTWQDRVERMAAAGSDIAGDPVTIMDARTHHCRWPLGDPRSSAFRFCGAHKYDGSSYCAGHALMSIRRPGQ